MEANWVPGLFYMSIKRSYRRQTEHKALYSHVGGCTCPQCTILAEGEFDNRFRKIPDTIEDDFLERLYKSNWKRNELDQVMWREYYSRLKQFAEAGYGKTLLDAADWNEFDLMERIKRNMSAFAGGKLNLITTQMRAYRGMSKAQFKKVGKGLLTAHNESYLEAEVQTALASANSASKWQDIQRRAYLYPNLRYETAGDERVRESHRPLDGVVYPVNHSFWNTWMPPNGWRCRCIVIQTDEPAKAVGDDFELEIPKAFQNNPGKTGKLFGDDHPYFDWSEKDLSEIVKQSEAFRADWDMSEVFQLASADVGDRYRYPGMSQPVELTEDFITSTLGNKHIEQGIHNDLITALGLMQGNVNLISVEGDTFIYGIKVADLSFTLTIKNNVFQKFG